MSAPPMFQRVAILGLGLLGGSLALALKERGIAKRVVGSGRRPEPMQRALAAGLVDEIGSPSQAVSGADLVVLACPVGAMAELVAGIKDDLAPGTIVTDVGSVKLPLTELLPGLLPPGVHFVGAHPMAGSHEKGNDHARADLFDDASCVVTPHPGSSSEAVARIVEFWTALGMRVRERDPGVHDDEVAWISHLPHLVAFAFAHSLGAAPKNAGEVAGTGFRDFTRIALSDAELWGEILSVNRKAIARPLTRFGESLASLGRAVDEGDTEALEQILATARNALAEVAAKATAAGGSSGHG